MTKRYHKVWKKWTLQSELQKKTQTDYRTNLFSTF